ncbi:MAG: hypothetical protein IJL53_10830 [Firmicutes bacterium]|nr:hypothetical protein [Bacillota bacterium]
MKAIKIISLILFAVIVTVPLCFFNTQSNAASEIDNRMLTENPFTLEGDLTDNLQNYVNDRIGFRDEMITAYTILNDRVFHKMVHPSYTYGKNGYVFGAGITTKNTFSDYHIAFADMIAQIQEYCNDRGVPFLFVFNPAKPAVYQDKIANGINYNREWVDLLFKELDKRSIYYLDNTESLAQLRKEGIEGFNTMYDANHWNDLGAFYGTRSMLDRLSKVCDSVHINSLDEFNVSEILQTSLLVSKFPIHEYVPKLDLKISAKRLRDNYYSEIKLNESYKTFGYFINNSEEVKDTPKALVFQGSYMNSYGAKYLINAFKEYIYVHDYQNVLDFAYYYNIFQPDCVIFEVAEYTFLDKYFSLKGMQEFKLNPVLSTFEEVMNTVPVDYSNSISIEEGESLTKIIWHTDQTYPYVWLELDSIYDMQKNDEGYETTIETTQYEESNSSIIIHVYRDDELYPYKTVPYRKSYSIQLTKSK